MVWKSKYFPAVVWFCFYGLWYASWHYMSCSLTKQPSSLLSPWGRDTSIFATSEKLPNDHTVTIIKRQRWKHCTQNSFTSLL